MNNKELQHFGIRGMKWGTRRTEAQLTRAKGNIDSASNIVREAKNINAAISSTKSTSKKKDISSLTNEQLKDKVTRMNLEQQYSRLSNDQTSKGQTFIKNSLEVAGSVLAIAGSAAAIAVAMKQLKV